MDGLSYMGEFSVAGVCWHPPIFALCGLSHPQITDKSIACSLQQPWAGTTSLWISRPTLIRSEMFQGCLDGNFFFCHAHVESVHLCLSLTPSISVSPVSWDLISAFLCFTGLPSVASWSWNRTHQKTLQKEEKRPEVGEASLIVWFF